MKKLLISLLSIILFSSAVFADKNYNYSKMENYSYSTPQNYKYNNDYTQTSDNEEILFIVDFSNSMNELLDSRTKLDVALQTMKDILQMIPPRASVGLRVYGHKTGFTPKQGCTASQLLAPIQQNNTVAIYSKLSSLNAVGWTPITYSLKQAAYSDFTNSSAKKRIVLISDGGENCDESPCDFIIELQKYRDDIRIDVIALSIGDRDANNQLKCVALVTSGKFYNANTADELKKSLQDSLNLQKNVQAEIINK
ncbi:VWA domain-containing protein [bacterium]|nr:VWA domain-containing protein [bacterium]